MKQIFDPDSRLILHVRRGVRTMTKIPQDFAGFNLALLGKLLKSIFRLTNARKALQALIVGLPSKRARYGQ